MKKRTNNILIIVFILFAINFVKAQVSLSPKFGLGITDAKFKVNYLNNQDGLTSNSKLSFVGGLGINFPLKGLFSLQTDFIYIQKGIKGNYIEQITNQFMVNQSYEYKIRYLEIPVLAKFQTRKHKFNPFFETGPSIGFRLNAKYTLLDNISPQFSSGTRDYKDRTTKADIAWQFGAGLGYNIGNNQLFLNARYTLGFTDIDKSSEPFYGPENMIEFKNRTWMFMLGYAIALNKK